jgi:carbon-monoxide dehydrogenase medium subunit
MFAQMEEIHNPMNAYPRLPEFDYIKPESYDDASQFLVAHAGEARPFIGGTDLFVQMRDRVFRPKYLVDIKGLEGMHDLTFDPSAGLTIGAAVNMNRVIAAQEVNERYQILAEAAQSVASYQLRTRATIVGNVCNASPAGDTIGASLLLGGMLNIFGAQGMRQVPLSDFFVGPGETILKNGDIVISIQFPVPPQGLQGRYIKLGRNRLSDLSIVGVTVVGWPDPQAASGCRFKLALASVAPVPLVVHQVSEILAQTEVTEESLTEAAAAAMEACTPIDDVRATARYRKYMVRNLSHRALKEGLCSRGVRRMYSADGW